eukprot:m.317511 g.317511  ORF g.317511 m.317511 type:complete len:713 (+) comp27556_c0_seq1:333-2471(+)
MARARRKGDHANLASKGGVTATGGEVPPRTRPRSPPSRVSRGAVTTVLVAVSVAVVCWRVGLLRGGNEKKPLQPRSPDGSSAASASSKTTAHIEPPRRSPPTVTAEETQREIRKAHADTQRGKHRLAVKRLERLLSRGAHADAVLDIRFSLADGYTALGDDAAVETQLRLADTHAQGRSAAERSDAAWGLAKLYLNRKTAPRAAIIEVLRRVVDANPAHDNALHWLGHQLMQSPTGYTEALQYLSRVRLDKLTDSHPLDTVMLLGQAHERVGNLEGTAAAFAEAVNLYTSMKQAGREIPDRIRYRFALSHFQYGKALVQLGHADRALELAAAASYDFPDVYHIMDITGVALAASGRWNETLAHYGNVARHLDEWPSDARAMPDRVLGATFAKLLHDHDHKHPGKGQRAAGSGDADASNQNRHRRRPAAAAAMADGDGAQANGGWPTQILHNLTTTRCNIDVRPGLTPEAFMSEYAGRNLPVIIPNAVADWPARTVWQRGTFAAKYGDKMVRVRRSVDIAYDNEFGGLGAAEVDLRRYLDETFGPAAAPIGVDPAASSTGNTRYVLQALEWGDDGFREDYIPPQHFESPNFAWNRTTRDGAALAYFGPAGSSVTLHEHTNAWNALVFGMKRWIMLPPYIQNGPTGLPVEQWLEEWYPKFHDDAYECTQYAGDLIYVPTNFMHTLINLQASIGVAVEFGHNTRLLKDLVRAARH